MRCGSKKAPGFTLIELMIVVAIIGSIVPVTIVGLHASIRRVQAMNASQAEIALSGQTSLAVMADDIRHAAAVEDAWEGNRTTERSLVLRLPSIQASTGQGFDRVAYKADARDPKMLVKQVFPAPGSRRCPTRQVLARNLSGMRFSVAPSLQGARVVSFELSFSAGWMKRRCQETFRSSAGLRNAGS